MELIAWVVIGGSLAVSLGYFLCTAHKHPVFRN